MGGLFSDLFSGDSALEGALTVDARHVVKGARGDHVRKIQAAVTLLLDPPCDIAQAELTEGRYGPTTAKAVLRYKTEKGIINRAYQTTPDDITGKMTTRALDDAMAGVEAELAGNMLRILARLERLLFSRQLMLSPSQRVRVDSLRTIALSLTVPGGPPGKRFDPDYRRGVALMNAMTPDHRPAIVFAAAPALAAGAALALFLILIAAVIALILLVELVVEAGKLGNRVSQAIEEAVEAGEQAIVDNVFAVDALDQAVEQCRRRSQNGTPECLAALAKFAAKKLDVVAKRNELQSILKDLRDALKGSPKKFVWKLLAKRAEAAGKALAQLERELVDIARDIIRECGCHFIRI